VHSIAVIGAGTMGSGIALTAAMSGCRVSQIDISPEQLDKAKTYQSRTLSRSVEKQRMTQNDADLAFNRIARTTEMTEAAAADWASEAATENVDVKKKVFQAMRATFRDEAVLATNTSSISITALAAAVGDAAPRVIGMHFFNPVPVMKLVEVIRGVAT